HVRAREVALVGGRLDLVHGEEAEDVPVLADGVAVDGEGLAAVVLDLLGEGTDGLRGVGARLDGVGAHGWRNLARGDCRVAGVRSAAASRCCISLQVRCCIRQEGCPILRGPWMRRRYSGWRRLAM